MRTSTGFSRFVPGAMKWWSPQERAVLFFDEARIEGSTVYKLRQGRFDFTLIGFRQSHAGLRGAASLQNSAFTVICVVVICTRPHLPRADTEEQQAERLRPHPTDVRNRRSAAILRSVPDPIKTFFDNRLHIRQGLETSCN